jgi:LexA DNA binding domain-containing protein
MKNQSSPKNPEASDESRLLRLAIAEATALLHDARKHLLEGIIQHEAIAAEIPVEADAAIECAAEAIAKALNRLESTSLGKPRKHRLSLVEHFKGLKELELPPYLESTSGGAVAPEKARSALPSHGPTRQQGQFLAFIREYMMRNYAGVAPSHAEFQRFFNLTPPSVNSMLIRLQKRGFIRRIPGKARAIELVINLDLIPPLDRPFKF